MSEHATFGPVVEIEAFGPGARLHHVGVVVPSIHASCPAAAITHDPLQGVKVAFVRLQGTMLELIEPCGDQSPVARSLEKGTKLVHLCYEVPDLEASLTAAAEHGFRRLSRPQPAVAFGGRLILWVLSKTYGLVELLAAEGAAGGSGDDA